MPEVPPFAPPSRYGDEPTNEHESQQREQTPRLETRNSRHANSLCTGWIGEMKHWGAVGVKPGRGEMERLFRAPDDDDSQYLGRVTVDSFSFQIHDS